MLLAPGYIAIFFFSSFFHHFPKFPRKPKKQHTVIRLRGWLCPFLWRFTPRLRTLSARLHGAGQGCSEQSSPGKSQRQSWPRQLLSLPPTPTGTHNWGVTELCRARGTARISCSRTGTKSGQSMAWVLFCRGAFNRLTARRARTQCK